MFRAARPARGRATRRDRGVKGGSKVPRRPGHGESPPTSFEAGLRALVRDAGPDIHKLSRGGTEGLRMIMETAEVPTDWPPAAKAAAILAVIEQLVQQITNPRWKGATLAAFRLPADEYVGPNYDSLTGRWRALARRERTAEGNIKERIDALRGYWITAAVRLAAALEDRIRELNSSLLGWQQYRTFAPPSPPRSFPVSFDQTDVLYRFEGYRGIQCISYRSLTAYGPVDHYEAVGWYYNEPDASVEIIPLANCALDGPLRDLPQGGRCATLKFSRTLSAGEHYFFAYVTNFNSQQRCRPTILYEVRGLEMQSLIIRAQFDPVAIPIKCWYFDVETQSEGWEAPPEGAPELLEIALNGYVDHQFSQCARGQKYGLRWEWAQ